MSRPSDKLLDQLSSQTEQKGTNTRASDALLATLGQQNRRRNQMVLDTVIPRNPDRAAEARKLSQYFGVDEGVIERNQDKFSTVYRARRAQQAMALSPVLRRQMRDPAFAALAHDDVEHLTGIESAIGAAQDIGISGAQGLAQIPQSFVGLADILVDYGVQAPVNYLSGQNYHFYNASEALGAVGVDIPALQSQLQTLHTSGYLQALQDVTDTDGFLGTLAAYAQHPSVIINQTLQSLPAMFAGAKISRGLMPYVSQPAALGAGEGLVQGGITASQYSQDGLAPREATAAIMSGTLTGILGGYGSKVAQFFRVPNPETIMAKGFKEASSDVRQHFLATVGGSFLTEGVFEEMPQEMQEQIWQNYAGGKPLMDGIGNAGASGVLLGGFMGSGFGGVQHMAVKRMSKARQAQVNGKKLADMAQFAAASKVRERDRQSFESFVRDAAEEGDVETVYLDSGVLLQSENADALAELSPAIAQQYQQAAATGGTIAIPTEEYASTIAASEFNDELMPHLRVGDPEAFTASEADAYIDNMQAELQGQAEHIVSQMRDRSAFDESAARVKESLTAELQATGRIADHNVEPTAALYSSYYNVRAAQLGITPGELVERMSVRFQAARQAQGGLNQALASQPPKGWQHVENGDDLAAMWDADSAPEAMFLTDLDGKLNADYPGLSGYSHSINRSAIRHIRNQHGAQDTESSRGQVPVTHEDIATIPSIVTEYDAIREVKDKHGRSVIGYAKHLGDGVTIYIERVSNKRRNLSAISMWKYPPSADAESVLQQALADHTPETDGGMDETVPPASDTLNQSADFDQPESYDFDVNQYRDSVVNWAKERFGDAVAPNGNPVWQNFVAWFGDSAVVDEEGQPLVVYHGTSADFDTFDPNMLASNSGNEGHFGAGHYFTIDPREADYYGNSTGAYFLSIKNPVRQNGESLERMAQQFGYEKEMVGVDPDWLVEKMQGAGDDAALFANMFADGADFSDGSGWDDFKARGGQLFGDVDLNDVMDVMFNNRDGELNSHDIDFIEQTFGEIPEHARRYDYEREPQILHMTDHGLFGQDFTRRAQSEGYDGVMAGSEFVIFDSSQAKSAIGNDGNYSPDTGNILHQSVFHGSPFQDIQRFDLQKIGTGEGNQSFGWGIYFTNREEIAEAYRSVLAGETKATTLDGEPVTKTDVSPMQWQAIQALARPEEYNPDTLVERMAEIGAKTEKLQELRDALKDYAGRVAYKEVTQGAVYQAEIPDNNELLSWDVPFSEQPKAIRQRLRDVLMSAQVEQRALDDFGAETRAELANMVLEPDATGEYIYGTLSDVFRTPQGASVALEAAGIPGLRYLDKGSRADGDGTYNYVIWDQEHLGNNVSRLYQDARGSFDPSSFVVSLLEGSDLTTALHEGAHFFFEADMRLAGQLLDEAQQFGDDALNDGEREILDNVHKMFNWHGIEGPLPEQLAMWASMDSEQRRHYHERTAETFERYLFTGQAPSFELQIYFQRFRAWMLGVYKSIDRFLQRNDRAQEIDPDIKAVFDRMLATTEQIQIAEQGRSMMPLFDSPEQSGMTPEEYAAYQKEGVEASNEATDELQAKAVRDLQYTKNIRNEELKRLRREAAGVRRETRIQVRKEVMQQPVYQAWQWLTGKLGDADKLPSKKQPKQDSVDPTRDSLFVAMAKLGGLDRAEVVNEWGLDPADAKTIGNGHKNQPVVRAEGGRDIDDMRRALREYGYLGGDFGETTDGLQSNQHDFEGAFFGELAGDEQHSRAYEPQEETLEGGSNLEGAQSGRLDIDALRTEYSDEEVARLKAFGMTAGNGWNAELVALKFGYDSGEALIDDILGSTPPSALIEVLTDRRMAEQHAELATDQALEQAADEAIHNRSRARTVATEANALDKAMGGKRALMRAANEMADAVISRLQLREIKPRRYASAAARAARAAKAAFKKADVQVAATEKRNELAQLQLTNRAYKARQEIDKHLRYLRKFNSSKLKLDPEYLQQIHGLLEKYELRSISDKQQLRNEALGEWVQAQIQQGVMPAISESLLSPQDRVRYQAQVSVRDTDGSLRYADDDARMRLLAGFIEQSQKRPYKSMTMEELRGLVDAVKNMEHLGRLKHELLTNRKNLSYEDQVELVREGIWKHGKGRRAKNRSPVTKREHIIDSVKSFGAKHIRVATYARIMDGGNPGGAVWSAFVQEANRRQNAETQMKADATKALADILEPLWRGRGAHKLLPTKQHLGRDLTRESVIAIALNMGNEGNRQRLLDGEGWNARQVQPVLQMLSTEEWQAVQQVWDYINSYWPMIEAKETRIYGVAPEKVVAQPLVVRSADGDVLNLEGGYYPVKYDPLASARAGEQSAVEEADAKLKGAYTSATTHRSFTKGRVEKVKGRPLLLRLDGVYTGVADVIHDLAWHEWLIDANKLMRSQRIQDAMRETYGQHVVNQFKSWVEDIAVGARGQGEAMDHMASLLSKNISLAKLGFSVWTAAQMQLGHFTTVSELGAKWYSAGMRHYLSNPASATREAGELSMFMRNRTRTRFRDLNEIRNRVQKQNKAVQWANEGGYAMLLASQKVVDTVAWWGAYERAMSESKSDEDAVSIADQMVIDTQAGGELADRPAIMRGGATSRLFTVFMDYMNAALNYGYMRTLTRESKMNLVMDYLLVFGAQGALYAALRNALTAGDDDRSWEEKMLEMAGETISFSLGGIAGLREFGGLFTGFDYRGPAGLSSISDVYSAATQVKQGELDSALARSAINVIGDFTGLPSTQINRTIRGADAVRQGKTDNAAESVQALTFGFSTKK